MILITGFGPFGGLARNPSAEVAEAVAGGGVEAVILPVDYAETRARLERLLDRPRDAVVLMGVAIDRPQLSLERVAINYIDRTRPDNAGCVPEETAVVPGGPDAYFSTLPLDSLHAALADEGVPVGISLTAGAYLCNAAFYLARHLTREWNTPCGFLHLPPTARLSAGAVPVPFRDQVRAVRSLLAVLAGF